MTNIFKYFFFTSLFAKNKKSEVKRIPEVEYTKIEKENAIFQPSSTSGAKLPLILDKTQAFFKKIEPFLSEYKHRLNR